jgi:hypothetical protein
MNALLKSLSSGYGFVNYKKLSIIVYKILLRKTYELTLSSLRKSWTSNMKISDGIVVTTLCLIGDFSKIESSPKLSPLLKSSISRSFD